MYSLMVPAKIAVMVFSMCIVWMQSSTYAAAAAGIMAIEAGHAAVIRERMYAVSTWSDLAKLPLHDINCLVLCVTN